jgi:hypothetical protein
MVPPARLGLVVTSPSTPLSASPSIASAHSVQAASSCLCRGDLVSKRCRRVIIMAWPSIGIIPIWRHLHPLAKRIANEYREHSETDEPKKQVRHVQPAIAASVGGSSRYAAHNFVVRYIRLREQRKRDRVLRPISVQQQIAGLRTCHQEGPRVAASGDRADRLGK